MGRCYGRNGMGFESCLRSLLKLVIIVEGFYNSSLAILFMVMMKYLFILVCFTNLVLYLSLV